MLIPAYRDMDPYDLPADFSHLQALDMSKLGFMQDLVRGIQKILQKPTHQTPASAPVVQEAGTVEPLLRRAFMFIGDGDFKSAADYCERVLDRDPENARAYIGKLLIELRLRGENQLAQCTKPLDGYDDFQRALDFADPQYRLVLDGYKQSALENTDKLVKEKAQKREKKFKEARVKVMQNLQIAGALLVAFGLCLVIASDSSSYPVVPMLFATITFVLSLFFGVKVAWQLISIGSLSDIKRFLLEAKLGGSSDGDNDEETAEVIAEVAVASSTANVNWEKSRIRAKNLPKRTSSGSWHDSDFFKYIISAFQRWSQFHGRSTRKELIYFVVINVCFLGVTFQLPRSVPYLYVLESLYGWALMLPLAALMTRRLHDIGHSAIPLIILPVLQLLAVFYWTGEFSFYVWNCIPRFLSTELYFMFHGYHWSTPVLLKIATILFLCLLIYLMAIPGQRRKNRFGPNPLLQ